jgi:hypothetical protein
MSQFADLNGSKQEELMKRIHQAIESDQIILLSLEILLDKEARPDQSKKYQEIIDYVTRNGELLRKIRSLAFLTNLT